MIIADRHGRVQTISGIGQAAQNIDAYHGEIPTRGPRSALTSAGTVDAMAKAFAISRDEIAGTKSWEELLTPAFHLARDGFPMTESERFWLNFRLHDAKSMADVYKAYSHHGQVPEAGHIRRQLELSATIAMLAERGPRDFYEGKLAAIIGKGLAGAGSPLTMADLAGTSARIETPLCTPYRGGTLVAHRPPTQGITTLEIMGILQRFDMRSIAEGSADYYHLLVEAVKQAFIDRNRHVADPDLVDVPTGMLLSDRHLDSKARSIRMDRALPWPHAFKEGDTVYVGATDEAGNSASLLATLYFDWGSGVMVGNTGLIWHNRGASFSLDPKHPNCLAPGKRPFHTLNPGMYFKNGKANLLYGTQGADGQPQTLAAILTRMIDYGLDPMSALARPRFLLGKTFSDSRDSLKLEEDVPDEICLELMRRGHALSKVSAQSPLMGHAGAIVIAPLTGVMTGAHDPRSDGQALGVDPPKVSG
jgi:gamma-glutamyltranspeptidase/glutathione hydrolase